MTFVCYTCCWLAGAASPYMHRTFVWLLMCSSPVSNCTAVLCGCCMGTGPKVGAVSGFRLLKECSTLCAVVKPRLCLNMVTVVSECLVSIFHGLCWGHCLSCCPQLCSLLEHRLEGVGT